MAYFLMLSLTALVALPRSFLSAQHSKQAAHQLTKRFFMREKNGVLLSTFGLLCLSVVAIPAHADTDGGTFSISPTLSVSGTARCVPSATPLALSASFDASSYDVAAGNLYAAKSSVVPIAAGNVQLGLSNCPSGTTVYFKIAPAATGSKSFAAIPMSGYKDFLPSSDGVGLPTVDNINSSIPVMALLGSNGTFGVTSNLYVALYPKKTSNTYVPVTSTSLKQSVNIITADQLDFKYVFYTTAKPDNIKNSTNATLNGFGAVTAFEISLL